MRAIIWAAVSSKPQLEGDSLESQIRDAAAACNRFGWEIIAKIKVPGHSRDYIFYQDAAKEVRAYREFQSLCENGSADLLVCRGRDRLGRTDALIAQVEALASRAGMQIYSMAMPSAIVEPERASQDRGALYAAAIERASAQAEMVELRRRHQMGMRARVRRGLPAGVLPFGYGRNSDNPVPVQIKRECDVIRRMLELYLRGWGYRRIAGWLNEASIAPVRAEAWEGSVVRGILRNSFYAGWVFHGDIIAPGKHQPLFSAQEWAQLKQEQARRRQTRGRREIPIRGKRLTSLIPLIGISLLPWYSHDSLRLLHLRLLALLDLSQLSTVP